MYDKKILSLLIALTKEIRLTNPVDCKGYQAQFFAGNKTPFPFSGGIGITWWYTAKAFELCNSIASMSIEKYEQLKDGDKHKLSDGIKNAFCAICLNSAYFNSDDVFLKRKQSLFEARSINDVSAFSRRLWSFIMSQLEKSIGLWCFVYPLPRLTTESFELMEDNISVVKKSDKEVWKKFELEYPETKFWDPSTGFFEDGKDTPFSRIKYEALLICCCEGTSDGAKFKAKIRFKRFLSILFGLFRTQKNLRLTKSDAQPYSSCIQFKHKDNQSSGGTILSGIGELLPYYITDFELNDDIISILRKWYGALFSTEQELKDRIKKAAHFINNAMTSNDIDSYIHYFISLDALFGKRGDVERLIIEGVKTCLSDEQWTHKAKWLYDLRSEFVHGGARFEEEWKDFERYVKHFGSHPFTDVMDLAFQCILKRLIPNLPDKIT